jgi:hypothetical protein
MTEQNTQPDNNQQQQIQIKVSDEILKGSYANTAIISHTPEEFVLDFVSFFPNSPAATMSSRILVSPGHLKRIIAALQDNVKKYEEQFGSIKTADVPEHKIGFRTE